MASAVHFSIESEESYPFIRDALYDIGENLCSDHAEGYAVSAISQGEKHPFIARPRPYIGKTVFGRTEGAAPGHIRDKRDFREKPPEFAFQGCDLGPQQFVPAHGVAEFLILAAHDDAVLFCGAQIEVWISRFPYQAAFRPQGFRRQRLR